jgi:hypothetical protein
MNNVNAAPAVTGDSKTLISNVTPIKRDADAVPTIVPTAAKGNDEVMSQPAKQS